MTDVTHLRLLFLCTGNACRSQMAEGWARHLFGDRLDVHSAGLETHGLDRRAVRVMAEAGVDISGHRSTRLDELEQREFDVVVTVCDHAHESCPVFPATRVVHVGFEDPPKLVAPGAGEQEALDCYRRVRDRIRETVENLEQLIGPLPSTPTDIRP